MSNNKAKLISLLRHCIYMKNEVQVLELQEVRSLLEMVGLSLFLTHQGLSIEDIENDPEFEISDAVVDVLEGEKSG